MMKTIKETAQELLLNGEHINKAEFHSKYHTFTLTQRIEELRRDGWAIKSKTIPGRKGMVEYWLEPDEIERIKNLPHMVSNQEQNEKDEQLLIQSENLAETCGESLKSEDNAYFNEQLGIGLLGGHNY